MSSVITLEENAARTLKRTPCRFRNPKFGASMAYTIRKIQRKTGIVFSAIIKNRRGEANSEKKEA